MLYASKGRVKTISAVFNWNQTIGAPAGTAQDLGSSGNLIDFKNVDTIGTSDYSNYPVSAGQNSFEVWLRGHFSGTYNFIYDFRFWMSADFSPNTGLTVNCNSQQQVYGQPTNASSSIATSTIGTSDPGAANVSYGGSLTSSIQSSVGSQFTDYIVLQLQTTVSAPAGDTSLATFSLSYIET
jgi:hypothetical protein